MKSLILTAAKASLRKKDTVMRTTANHESRLNRSLLCACALGLLLLLPAASQAQFTYTTTNGATTITGYTGVRGE